MTIFRSIRHTKMQRVRVLHEIFALFCLTDIWSTVLLVAAWSSAEKPDGWMHMLHTDVLFPFY